MTNKNILLIVTASIAAYKSADLVSSLKKLGYNITCVMSESAKQFITPLSLAALSGNAVYSDIFSLKDESDMGHIKLSRLADLVIVAPASCDIIAKFANGIANDLASTILLATNKQIMIAPAMNVEMWNSAPNIRNVKQLKNDGILFVEPAEGVLACGEYGAGKLANIDDIIQAIENYFNFKPLKGYSAIVTAGPTQEPLDPIRYMSNYSSGKQGYAIADSLITAGANVTLISGPVAIDPPANVNLIKVKTCQEMFEAVNDVLPCDIGIFTAAVADFRAETLAKHKIKKVAGPLTLNLIKNPDILSLISISKNRPKLLIGFAAETENLIDNAKLKLIRKNLDYIIANEVAENLVFNKDHNKISIISKDEVLHFPETSKKQVAEQIISLIIKHFGIIIN
jgi:phosphopantothenoylcysteine decarboxylase/phosphopantothenate--cysteine ligase